MKVESHILGRDGKCSRCQMQLGGIEFTSEPWRDTTIGDRIGLITDTILPPSAYLITRPEMDSNRLCELRGESVP